MATMPAIRFGDRPAPARADNDEDAMTRKFPAASKLATLLAAAALVAVGATSANAQSRQQYDRDGRPYYGANGPNRSYQQGPRTRVYVTTRSWLDAGTEVLPGDRKFHGLRIPAGDRLPNVRDAKTTTARSTASRLTRRRIWVAIRSGSRCRIDSGDTLDEKNARSRPGIFCVAPRSTGRARAPGRSARKTVRWPRSGNRSGARR